MNIDLKNKLNTQEQNEVRLRAYSMMEQMYLDGISMGRELSRDTMFEDTEKMLQDRLSLMSNYILVDAIWGEHPPKGYNPNKTIDSVENLDIPDAVDLSKSQQPTMINPSNIEFPNLPDPTPEIRNNQQ